ncbi:18645_t:CDS:2, partial [Acaulospora morrowiae]
YHPPKSFTAFTLAVTPFVPIQLISCCRRQVSEVENDKGGETLGSEICSSYIATATMAVNMFMTTTWAVSKLSLPSSKELHGVYFGGDSVCAYSTY